EQKRTDANAAAVTEYRPVIQEREVSGVRVLDIKPRGWRDNKRVLVYTHGGAYTMYSAKSRLMSAVPMANDTGLRVISVDYTLAPAMKWNATTDQVIAVIRTLMEQGHSRKNIAIYGESA